MQPDSKIEQAEAKLRAYFEGKELKEFRLIRTQSDYYDKSLEERKDILGVDSPAYLCKALIMQNTNYNEAFAGQFYPRFVCVVTQYVERFNNAKLEKFIKERQHQECEKKVARKYVHFRLCKEETAFELTGYEKNEVCPVVLTSRIPVVVSRAIRQLDKGYFCMGAGHKQLKLALSFSDFARVCDNTVLCTDLSEQ